MYDLDSTLIAAILFASMAAVIELGYRIGQRREHHGGEPSKDHVNAIQASLLGVLALLLGFTFSLALQRYDGRSVAVVTEANAIGTAYLRAELLPAPADRQARERLRDYLALRVEAGNVNLIELAQRQALLDRASTSVEALWELAVKVAKEDPNPVTTGLFLQALNDMIDAFGSRDAELNRHVPELVLVLLHGTFLMTGVIVGYAAGVAGHRASFVTYIMVTLIVLLVFIIIDLDRPRRGIIEVSQQSMVDLQTSLAADPDDSPPRRASQ